MRLISFDVGIKNMAYCIFNITEQPTERIEIIDWNILNLMNEECVNVLCSSCTKPAKYKKENENFCLKHAKTSKYTFPNKSTSLSSIRKLKKEDLIIFCHKHFIFVNHENKLIKDLPKQSIIETANHFFQSKTLEPIIKIKKTATDTDLISVGKNMKTILDKMPNIDLLTHVIIENQISPIATRMKTIQGMLTQYFIIKGSPDICIEYISSSNKLKGLINSSNIVNDGEIINNDPENTSIKPSKPNSKTKYKQNKKDGIIFCSHFLKNNSNLNSWDWTMNMTKKDDYADAFLQGIWYLKQNKYITYLLSGENKYQLNCVNSVNSVNSVNCIL
jgi:hypothetical protein